MILLQFSVNINRGKDLMRDTVEMNIMSDPSTFVAVHAWPYELYKKGVHTFLSEHKVTCWTGIRPRVLRRGTEPPTLPYNKAWLAPNNKQNTLCKLERFVRYSINHPGEHTNFLKIWFIIFNLSYICTFIFRISNLLL